MDEHQYYLELPEYLRHLVAKDAPLRVAASVVEFKGGGETIPLLAGVWRLDANHKWQQFQVQVFLANLEATAFSWVSHQFDKQLVSREDYEAYPPHKIQSMVSRMSIDRIERHFSVEGLEERLKFSADRKELFYGFWIANEENWHPDTVFSHQIFAAYREFFELSDKAVIERIFAEMEDEANEINLAHRWGKMNLEEQFALAFQCENGTWEELVELYRCLLIIMANQAQIPSSLAWDMCEQHLYCEMDIEMFEPRWLSIIQRWQTKIYEQFKPKYFLNSQQQPIFLSSWHSKRQMIVVSSPTNHERLEAQLHLSEWAHAHLSPAEAETLLQFE